jgi:hypothetical protein
MTRILTAIVLAGALPALAQAPPGPAVPPPGEIVIPQYTDEAPRPSDAPTVLSPEEKTVYERSRLHFVRATNDVTLGGLTLDRAQFYTVVGRTDLAKEAQARNTSRIVWITSGSVVAAAGLVAGLILIANNDNTQSCSNLGTPYEQCNPVPSNSGTWAGLGLTIGGVVVGVALIAVGIATTGPVTTPAEDEEMVKNYNRALLDKLSGKASVPSPTPAVGFDVGPGGGRLQLGWRF